MTDVTEAELQRAIGRLEAAVQALTREVRDANKAHEQHDTSLDRRVTRLEQWKVYLVAFGAGAAAVVSVLSLIVWRLLALTR